MQKSKAIFTCQVRLSSGKRGKLEEVYSNISKSVKVSNGKMIKNLNNRDMLVFNAEYGPHWGSWASDIRRHIRNAQKKVGSTATLEIANEKRTIVETRSKLLVL